MPNHAQPRRGRRIGIIATTMAVAAGFWIGFFAPPALAIDGAVFTGSGSGQASVGGNLYARQGAALTLTVTAPAARCVTVTGAYSLNDSNNADQTVWTFTGLVAPAGDGVQSVTAKVFKNKNCGGGQVGGDLIGSFGSDNTAPVVNASITSATGFNSGWSRSDVTVDWQATDPVVNGVASNNIADPPNSVVTTNGTTTVSSGNVLDAVGNSASRSETIKVDKLAPTVSGVRAPGANSFGWNNTDVTATWSCADNPAPPTGSGIQSCPAQTVVSTEGTGLTATSAPASDIAGNTAAGSVGGINIDKTAPTLSGAPTVGPNGSNGWYTDDVTIAWAAADDRSGLDPGYSLANSTITGEGTGLTASRSVADKAGNLTTATSAPAVKIDRTKPATTATAPAGWQNTDAAVTLSANDNLSGVAATHFVLDGGATQTGTSVAISVEGDHTLSYWSVDNAGNTEVAQTIHVKVDKTAPTISGALTPVPNANGWNNSNVTVSFTCADGVSGVATCTPDQSVTTEGVGQVVTGTATDSAGNIATADKTVNLDKTKPTISASTDRAANGDGWYNAPVIVTFDCADALSGMVGGSCEAPVTVEIEGVTNVSGHAADAADNTDDTSLTVRIDEQAPTVTGHIVQTPNANGWFNASVTIVWTCSDATSGLAQPCPAPTTFSSEGENGTAISPDVHDKAGNVSHGTVSGIDLDLTGPTTTAGAPASSYASGWYANPVPVTLAATDATSGVAHTYYAIDNGTAHTYSAPISTPRGVHTVTFWSIDKADNLEDDTQASQTITIKVDDVDPTISGAATTAPNANDWYNHDVDVEFTCSDSETAIASCGPNATLKGNGAGQSATGTAVDDGGNSASTTVSGINIDKAAPTLSGAATSAPNAHGWYNSDVTIHWTSADTGGSGLDGATVPGDAVIASEGAGQTLDASVSDLAGNTTNASSSPAVNLDKTDPTISGSITTAHSSGIWFNTDVHVHWTCDDSLSGVASCPVDTTVSGQGDNLSATRTATDKADNTASATVDGIHIDTTAPSTGAIAPSGWYATPVTVQLSTNDNLSGVAATHFRTSKNGAAFSAIQTGTEVVFDEDGVYQLQYWSVDNAGNEEAHQSATVQVDRTAPTIHHDTDRTPNAANWFNQPVTVTFTCDDNLSGVASCTAPIVINTDGAAQDASGTAVDQAGNVGNDPFTVNLDTIKPVITGAADRAPNSANWYRDDVVVSFTCTDDDGSGVHVCEGSHQLGEGEDQSITGSTTDVADNTNSTTMQHINIDKTAPTISGAASPAPNAAGWNNTPVTVSWNCHDSLSGIATGHCPVDSTVDGPGTNLGASQTVDDIAGNQSGATVGGINIDLLNPTTTDDIPPAPAGGWFGSDVTVTLTASDDLSGVAATKYVLDGGEVQNYTGPFVIGHGSHTLRYLSTDRAGNVESAHVVEVFVDTDAPTITATATPAANANGWRKDEVVVTFECSDSASGIATCPNPVHVPGPAADETVTGTAVDQAGHTASVSIQHIRVDQDNPTLSGSPDATGWVNHDVVVTWTCGDATSGVDGDCPSPSTVTGEGATLSASQTILDKAGNSTTTAVSGIKIDRTPPTTSADAPSTWQGSDVTVTLTATDSNGASGVKQTHYTVNGGAVQTGTEIDLGEGTSALQFWSEDNAGNVEARHDATVRIDKTAPTISHTQHPAAVNGWNNTDVTVTFDCTDEAAGSGIAACDGSSTLHNEGAGQTAHGTARDNAGNTAHDNAVVNIDKTAPTIAPSFRSPDHDGWYNSPVQVTWTCDDNLSGVTCPAPATLTEGLTSVTDTVTDGAGNQASSTAGPLQIDTTAPSLTGVASHTGWFNGDVTVTWSCDDALSGIPADSCPAPTVVIGEGDSLSATASVTDTAGNTTTRTVTGIKIDRHDPATHATITGTEFNGWYVPNPKVTLSTDADLSGVVSTTYRIDSGANTAYTEPFSIPGGHHVVTFHSVDNAGNVEADKTVTVDVDNVDPTIEGAPTTPANANGWYKTNPTVSFTCNDAQSGVAAGACGPDQTVTTNGANQSVTGTALDRAGNSASKTVAGINLDKVAPTVAIVGAASGGQYVVGSRPTPTCSASDALSGLAGACSLTLNSSGVAPDGTGTYVYNASATDKAGNTSTATLSFAVVFGFSGFLQPVTNTAHDLGTASVFKGGSTVPLKFALTNSSGGTATPSVAPYVLSLVQGPAVSGSGAGAAYSTTETVGSSFKATGDQWQFNFSTKGLPANYYYTLTVKLSDGTTKSVLIGLR